MLRFEDEVRASRDDTRIKDVSMAFIIAPSLVLTWTLNHPVMHHAYSIIDSAKNAAIVICLSPARTVTTLSQVDAMLVGG